MSRKLFYLTVFVALVALSMLTSVVYGQSITNVNLSPPSPAALLHNEYVNITFDYATTESEGVRIFAEPFTNGSWTPQSATQNSPLYGAGKGSGTGFFTIKSGDVVVDQIGFQMTNSDQSVLLLEFFVPVEYHYGNSITNINLSPPSPAALLPDEYVNITFDYATTELGGVRIFARPFTNGARTPNYGAHASPLHSAGKDSGTGFFTIRSGDVIVDQIRFKMTNSDQSEVLLEFFVPVEYHYGSFTVADFIVVDDFESYNDLEPRNPLSNRIYLAWIDGFDDPRNGSIVGYIDPPFVERNIVHSGNQSMPFEYNNAVGKSEATLTLTYPRDWTERSVNTLSIWFKGKEDNAAAPMYVVLNDSALVQHDDPDAAKIASWTQWNIPLQAFADQGVNLANVNSITLGFGNRVNPFAGGSGLVFFDDIWLHQLVGDLLVAPEATIRGELYSYQVAMSPDGGYVLVGDERQEVITFATSKGSVLWKYSLPAAISMEGAAISMDGNLIVVGGQGGSVFAFSKTSNLLWESEEPRGEVNVAITEAGDKSYAVSYDTLHCYNAYGDKLWENTVNVHGWYIWGISTTPTGERILLATNSDVILCDEWGNEIGFFDVVSGNHLVDADISDDGRQFIVSFSEEIDGTKTYHVALYSVVHGEQWKRAVDYYGRVRIDAYGRVFCTIRNGSNYLWDNAGNLLLDWADGGVNLDIDRFGSRSIVGRFSEATVYRVSTE